METHTLIKALIPIINSFRFNPEKQEFNIISDVSTIECQIKIPPLMIITAKTKPPALNHIIHQPIHIPSFLCLLIQAGCAALGISQNGDLIQHKIIKKYMVRKGQGRAQIYYVARKGKARGGAKLRLAKTKEFFTEINQKLQRWEEDIFQAKLILLHCSIRLWTGLFATTLPPPFTKSDPRIHKIPINIYRPSLKELKRVHSVLLHGYISIKADKEITTIDDAISLLLESYL